MALNLSAALQSSPVHSFLRPVRLKALDSSNRAPRELATPHHTLSNQCTLQPQPPSFLVSTRSCQRANGHNHDTIAGQLQPDRSRWIKPAPTRGIRLFAFFLFGKRPDAEPSLKGETAGPAAAGEEGLYTLSNEHATVWEGRRCEKIEAGGGEPEGLSGVWSGGGDN
jgi:hypothetical protein